ncbi:MAG: aminotransferase class III-fold pyridoxal phosphate-dependent enzyme, partial [Oscillospiraceae bacterium]|nr:aminotransferase class III-fold pyridoxal phosphate-dependent enzyme [Oscillospiraceae bacterium]
MTFEELREKDSQYVVQSYGRNPIAIDHGEGAVLYGADGKEYIDFASGIGVLSVGTANPKWAAAVAAQAGKLAHVSNLYYSEPYIKLAEKLCTRSGMAAAFFGNSGAEGNEGVIKLARKYSWEKYGEGRGTVITLNRSFHGRTITTLAATGQDVFHQYFFPFTEGFRRADPTIDSVQQAAGHDVCAVLVEL